MDKDRLAKLKDRFKNSLREHYVVRPETSLQVGGVVDCFLNVTEIRDLIDVVLLAQEINLPYIVLGQGSNVIFSDFGFPGLVILNRTNNISFLAEKSQVIVDSGVKASALAIQTAGRDLGGIEFLSKQTGSIGSAIYNHAKLGRQDIFQQLTKITIINPRSEVLTYKSDWLKSTKSLSRLRDLKINNLILDEEGQIGVSKRKNDPVILTAVFQLQRSRQEDIIQRIKSLGFGEKESNYPASGDIFSDPENDLAINLLKKSGVAKLKVGDMAISPNSDNRILNKKAGTSNDARKLVELMQSQVFDKTGINLDRKIEYLGVW